jgi:hypothetical protein
MIHHSNGRIERGDTPLWLWNLGKALLWLFWGVQFLAYFLCPYCSGLDYLPGWPHEPHALSAARPSMPPVAVSPQTWHAGVRPGAPPTDSYTSSPSCARPGYCQGRVGA